MINGNDILLVDEYIKNYFAFDKNKKQVKINK